MLLRVSYSVLNMWSKGDYDGAINAYLGNWPEPTPAMELGKNLHKKWQSESAKTNRLPEVFGGRKLAQPFLLETKAKRVIAEWIELVGVLDVKEPELGIDYKSGVTPATAYGNSFQHKVYQILYPDLKKFEYHGYNPFTRDVTLAICHLTQKTLEDGLEYVITYASELREYLESNNLVREEHKNASQTN